MAERCSKRAEGADFGLKVRLVPKGKSTRAEPIPLKVKAAKPLFADEFPELEAELARWSRAAGISGLEGLPIPPRDGVGDGRAHQTRSGCRG